MADPVHQCPKQNAPHGMEPYDVAEEGNLGALSREQQEKLNKHKIKTRVENEKYLREHPEVECLISGFLHIAMKPGGIDNGKTGGTDDVKPGGIDDGKPGGIDNGKTGGTGYVKPGGIDDGKPGGIDNDKLGGIDNGKTGSDDVGSIPVVRYSPNYVNMKIIDLGGGNILKNKEIRTSFFEHVAVVIYITAMSNYDQIDEEESDQNQLQESVNFFNTLCNRWFRDSTIFLVLNKKDLFAEKIKTTPLRTSFPEYTGSDDYEEAAAFVLSKFEAVDNMKNTRDIHAHLFSGANRENVQFLFYCVDDVIGRPRCNCCMLLL